MSKQIAYVDVESRVRSCTKCGEIKPFSEFQKRKSRPSGLSSHCKACRGAANKEYVRSNAERIRELRAEYCVRQADKIKAYQAQYREANRERLREYFSEYSKLNLHKKQATTTKRRANKLNATPKWANLAEIEKVYANARRISNRTGKKLHVDHVVPLVHRLVCGLHCEANLRIVPAEANLRKGNSKWPNMPC